MMLFVYILVLLHSVVYVWAEACTDIIQPEFKGMHIKGSHSNGTKMVTLFLRTGSAWIEVREIVLGNYDSEN
jgi:hypothetical protein